MKTVFKLLLLVALIAYLGFAFTNLTQKENKTLCTALNYTIADSTHAGFITGDEADRLLRKAKLYPIGKAMHQINSETIEMALKQNQFIDSVACYKAPNGTVNILIVQRLPLMRIISNNGEDYYLDSRGRKLKPAGYVADMVVATGNISSKFAQQHLVAMGRFLRDDAFGTTKSNKSTCCQTSTCNWCREWETTSSTLAMPITYQRSSATSTLSMKSVTAGGLEQIPRNLG